MRILSKIPNIVIATPGRLWDLIQNEKSKSLRMLAGIRFLVFDEVDRIVELGQFEELGKVLNFIYKEAINEQELYNGKKPTDKKKKRKNRNKNKKED